jgi:putative heme-binding domain-containing protein
LPDPARNYGGSRGAFLKGKPLPITDMQFGPDGALWFMVGGRRTQSAIYRVTWTGSPVAAAADSSARAQPGSGAQLSRVSAAQSDVAERLIAAQGVADESIVELAFEALDSPDRRLRFTARTALESQDPGLWIPRALAETRPWAAIEAMIALAHRAPSSLRERMLARIASWPIEAMCACDRPSNAHSYAFQEAQLVAALRALQLVLIRMGVPTRALAARSSGASTRSTHTRAPRPIAKCATARLPRIPARRREVARADRHHVQRRGPARARLAVAHAAHRLDARRAAALLPLAQRPGRERRLQLSGLHRRPAPRRDRVAERRRAHGARPAARRAQGRGDRREAGGGALRESTGPPRSSSRSSPRRAPAATSRAARRPTRARAASNATASPARAAALGRTSPAPGSRFSDRDLVEAMVRPSSTISDQYRDTEVVTKDDEVYVGRIVEDTPQRVRLACIQPREEELAFDRAEIAVVRPHALSRMPEGLLDALTEAQVLDLIAYLRAGGASGDPAFRAAK